jgi:glycerol-3-phosphate O-acyltransferase
MFEETVRKKVDAGEIPEEISASICGFYETFKSALGKDGLAVDDQPLLDFLDCIAADLKAPYTFEVYYEASRSPFDYYQWGLDFFRPLVKFDESKVLGGENLSVIEQQLAKGENVILLANHQAEPDPQVISLLLEKDHPNLAEKMIFVAGHRVVTDPLTKPFSRGRNLLCIFSKRYIEDEPELKQERLLHNQKTMRKMSELLAEGGRCIYVAPSGGRDRLGPDGKPVVAPFDGQSIEMFHLIAKQAQTPTHFYPLSLSSYNLLPPPNTINKDIGEARTTKRTPLHLAVGSEIDMDSFPGSEESNKKERRLNRASYITDLVKQGYEKL